MIALRILFACTFLVALCCSSMAKDDPSEKARPLLKAAAERSLFHAERDAAFGLLFSFDLRIWGAKPERGAYSWLVTPQGDSRQETRLPGYSDLEINRGTDLWIKRSVNSRTLPASWVEGGFSNFLYLDRAEDQVTRFWNTSEHHVDLRCVDLIRNMAERTLCFDQENNLRKVEIRNSYTTYEFSDYRQIGSKFAPGKIAVTHEGRIVIDGAMQLLTAEPKYDRSLLDPPAGAVKRVGCLRPSLPSLKKKVDPEYPSTFRSAHRQGTVIAYVLIASDGSVQEPTIIQTGGQYLDASVLKALPKWQFEPAKCGENPIEFDAEITIDFSLGMIRW